MAKLYFYYSTMNAGKSTALLQASHNYEERGMRTLLYTAQIDSRDGEVFHFLRRVPQLFAARKKTTSDTEAFRPVQNPEGKIDKVYPKVEDTSAARKSVIVKPGFIGTVRIMKNKIRGEDFPEFPASDNSPDL